MDGIIIIKKAAGMTSHDVVNKLRKILKTKKVGHAGTLDPDATGVLVICINKATKILQFLSADTKEYIATLKLGTHTTTYDASGEVLESKDYEKIADEKIETVIHEFLGPQKQVPPIYSAIKINGKKAYEYARNNEELVLEPRDICINAIEVLSIENDEITFKVNCSKGTYIRSLCVDIARKLGYPGHMLKLIRTKSGIFDLDKGYTLEEVEAGNFKILPKEDALSFYPSIVVENENIAYHGKKIKSDLNTLTVIKNKNNEVLAMYEPDQNGYLKSIRGLW